MKNSFFVASLMFGSAVLLAQSGSQGLDPADIVKPLANEWRTYSGDLSGKRYSALELVNTSTVKNLSLKWVSTPMTGCGPNGTGGSGGGAGGPGGGGGGGRGGGGGGYNAP